MGRAVSTALDAREDVVVAARFDRGEMPDLSLCDVIIDFSTPDASVELARTCAERGGPALVIGSTGLTAEQEAEIHEAAGKIAIVRSGNFSCERNKHQHAKAPEFPEYHLANVTAPHVLHVTGG